MKIGKLKVDDVDYKNGKANTWGFWSVRALSGEELMQRYIDATNCCYAQKHDETKEKSYRRINCRFLEQYEDYMVEQKYPGIHDRVNAKYRKDIEEGKKRYKELQAQKQADELRAKPRQR